MIWKPLHLFAVAIAGWMNRQQQEITGSADSGVVVNNSGMVQ
jgi:hypothetical protein